MPHRASSLNNFKGNRQTRSLPFFRCNSPNLPRLSVHPHQSPVTLLFQSALTLQLLIASTCTVNQKCIPRFFAFDPFSFPVTGFCPKASPPISHLRLNTFHPPICILFKCTRPFKSDLCNERRAPFSPKPVTH